jgi:hypothetical protein
MKSRFNRLKFYVIFGANFVHAKISMERIGISVEDDILVPKPPELIIADSANIC